MGGEEHRWGVESGWLRDSGLADGGEERRLGAGEWGTGRVGEGGSGDAAWVKAGMGVVAGGRMQDFGVVKDSSYKLS
jgi:hypothetical protein